MYEIYMAVGIFEDGKLISNEASNTIEFDGEEISYFNTTYGTGDYEKGYIHYTIRGTEINEVFIEYIIKHLPPSNGILDCLVKVATNKSVSKTEVIYEHEDKEYKVVLNSRIGWDNNWLNEYLKS